MAAAASRWGVQKQGKAVEHRECSLSSASWEGCCHSSFCSAPSDGQSSRQQGASSSSPSDWLSLLAKAHGIGWAREVSSKDWPMAEAAALPFSCCAATSGVEPISSESLGGGLEDGGDEVWGEGWGQPAVRVKQQGVSRHRQRYLGLFRARNCCKAEHDAVFLLVSSWSLGG